MKTKFTKKGRRILSAALCLLMMITALPMSAFAWTSEEGKSCTSSFGDYYVGSDGEYYRSKATYSFIVYDSKGNITVQSINAGNAKRKYLMTDNSGTHQVYCVESGVDFNTGNSYVSKSGKNSSYFQNLPTDAQFGIMMALMYGWHEGKSSPVAGTNVDDYAFATQTIIWEYQQQLRTSPSNRQSANGIDGDTYYYSLKGRPAEKCYNWILSQMSKHYICLIASVCLLGTAAFCGYHIYDHYADEAEQTEAFENIAEIVEQAQAEDGNAPEVPLTEEENILTEYGELYLKNTDMVGWLSIAGTTLNYPVMQTPNEPNYYLKRNFEKEYSDLGTPYIQENCDLTSSDNLVIYGHHIKGGKMFGALEDYKSQSFYEEHKTIQFDTLTQRGEYEIIAVFKTVAYSSQGFRYYDFVNAESEDEFNAYIQKCKELALYETGVTAEYGDRLITLSTCEYSAQNGRLVVVAKKTA